MQHRALFEPRAMQLYVLALVKFCEALTNKFSLWFIQGQEGTEQNKRVREALLQAIRSGLLNSSIRWVYYGGHATLGYLCQKHVNHDTLINMTSIWASS